MKKFDWISLFGFLGLASLCSGCEAIGDIFGAGVYTGVFLVIFVVVIIIVIITRIFKR
jgi:hypothetical protein